EGGEGEEVMRRMMKEEERKGFDLRRGPLWRVLLVRMGEREHVVVVTVHHIVADGWSLGVLLREVVQLYAGYSEGEPGWLPELEVQYGDYALWQREWLQGKKLEEELEYWRTRLGGAAVLELPTDRPRPALPSFRGGSCELKIEEETYLGLKELSRGTGVTMFMTLLAGFKVLLHRYTGQEDISVGTPIANRRGRELEGLIGFFVNTLVMRSEIGGEEDIEAVLKKGGRGGGDSQ